MNLKAMGQRLRRLREARGLTQAELAKKVRITREYVVRLEAGHYDPTLGVSARLAEALGVAVTDLIGRPRMRTGTCTYARDFDEGHTRRVDEDGVCEACAELLARFGARLAGGFLVRPHPGGARLTDGVPIPVAPRPVRLGECAACGERFKTFEEQEAFLGADDRWRFVHGERCRRLLESV